MKDRTRRDRFASPCMRTLASLTLTLTLTVALSGHVPFAAAVSADQRVPDLTIGADRFPDDDAVILRWTTDVTLDPDGTVHRREHRWVKLLNTRPVRRFGDQRIDFVNGRDQLVIHTAVTHLPDGSTIPVPDYSINVVGADGVGGWPEYAGCQQTVVAFGGIEPGAVLELDDEVVTPAGVLPWIDADLSLAGDYPIVDRAVSLSVPTGARVTHQFDRAVEARSGWALSVTNDNRTTRYEWAARDVPAARREPQSPPRHRRYGRLRYSTCDDPAAWVSAILERVNAAAQPDDAIRAFAQAATEDETDPDERVARIAKKLADSFNFVASRRAVQSLRCRPAATVFRSNYGNPLESCAVLLAALRSAGMTASPLVDVDATRWNRDDRVPPTFAAFNGVVVAVDGAGGPVYVHPRYGLFRNPGHLGRRRLLRVDGSGALNETYIHARGELEPSELFIGGKIVVDGRGRASGELRIRATGAFYDPLKLETAEAQKTRVADFVSRVLSGFTVSGYSVGTLSDAAFRVTANVSSTDALTPIAERRVLRLGDGPAFLDDIPMPLARSDRRTDVRINGRFAEHVDLRIEWPDGWAPSVLPAGPAPVAGEWGAVSQTIKVGPHSCRLRRDVTMTNEILARDDFKRIRTAVNDLRAEQSLLLVLNPSPHQD